MLDLVESSPVLPFVSPLPAADSPVEALDPSLPQDDWNRGKAWLVEGDDVFLQHVLSEPQVDRSLDRQNEHGDAWLHIAVRRGRWRSVAWLMEQGADPWLKNKHGHTPVWLARRRPMKHLPKNLATLVAQLPPDSVVAPATSESIKSSRLRGASKATTGASEARPRRGFQRSKITNDRTLTGCAAALAIDADVERFSRALWTNDTVDLLACFEAASLNGWNANGQSVLHEAVACGAWGWVERLVEKGLSLSTLNRHGVSVWTAIEQRQEAQDPSLDLDRYDRLHDAWIDEQAALRVAKGQGLVRSARSFFDEKVTGCAIDWKGLPDDPDRPQRPMSKSSAPSKTAGLKKKKSKAKTGPNQAARIAKNAGLGHRSPSHGPHGPYGGKTRSSTNARQTGLDRPLKEVNDYAMPTTARTDDVIVVRKVRRQLVKPGGF